MSDYFNENDPEWMDEQEMEYRDALADARADAQEPLTIEEYWQADPFHDWYAPGYVTEMDYMNAMEANDYLHESDDIDF